MAKVGRPRRHIDIEGLCEHIANGKSLVSWCKKNGVGYSTVMAHLEKDVVFQEKYAHARDNQADYLADEIIDISDEVGKDPAAQRLRVDTRKWAASKMKPKKYGEAQLLKHADAEGEKIPVTVAYAIPAAPNNS